MIEGRYRKALRATNEGLRELQRQRPAFGRQTDPGQRAARLAYLVNRRAHLLHRTDLLRLLLGRPWKLRAEYLSQRYTTRWGELLAV